MRLWHYKLTSVLPNSMLVSQWRECIAIKRQWKKGTLKHRLVSYVQDYGKYLFSNYVRQVTEELMNRNIKFQLKYWDEIIEFCDGNYNCENYPEHNDQYLKQCLYNLQEKADRDIITQEEWKKIEDKFGDVI